MSVRNQRIIGIVLIIMGILSVVSPVFADDSVKITILGTSDTHSNLYGFAYEDGEETKNNGMARISTYVEEKRRENPNTILIDNGDTYQGTILADAIYNKKADLVHPVSKVFNYLNYDAMVLGNHEFNFGIDFVEKIKKELKMPVLAANASYKDGRELAKPYTIVEKSGVKVGIIGLTNPNAPRWDGEKVDALEFQSILDAGKKYGSYLKNEEKVDVLVVAAHVGMIPEYDEENGSDGAEKLLEEFKDIDVLLLGHYHTKQTDKNGKTIIGAPRNNARDIVEFNLDLVKEDGRYVVKDSRVEVIDMEAYEPDEKLRDIIKEEHKKTIDFINGSGGQGEEEAGGGVFGKATADFQPENEILGIPEGKLRDTAVIELIAKVQQEVSGSDVTAVALFQDKSNLKKGDINYGSLFNIYKFDNTLYAVDVTGKELKDYMEWSAEHYNQWKEGDISISFDEDVPGYRYDMFKGVDYKIDLSKPVGERIKDVTYKGEPLRDDQVLTLSVNNYRYSSGLKANKLVEANKKWESPKAIREYIADYVEEKGEISPEVSNNWEIVGVNLDHPLRDEIIKLVNEKKLPIPYNESLNVYKLEEEGIIKDGKVVAPEEEVNEELEHSEGPVKKKEDKKDLDKKEETPIKEDKKEGVKTEEKEVIYEVKKGDFLIKIANKYGVNYLDIAKLNNIKNPNRIYPKQKLRIKIK